MGKKGNDGKIYLTSGNGVVSCLNAVAGAILWQKNIAEAFGGKVPGDLDALLTLKGVGGKTANLVLTQGFNKLGICVDTHVHRISNRLGFVKTKDPTQTEFALRKILPKRYWIEYNDLLVAWGQNVCKPVSPLCSICAINKYCPKIGVDKSR